MVFVQPLIALTLMMAEPVTLSEDQMKTLVEKLSEQLAPILKPPGDPPGTSGHVVTFSGGGGKVDRAM